MSDPTPKRETELDPSTQSIPRRIGRYDVKRLLGRGGMGRVFYAVDSELDRPVALKVIHPSLADTPDVMERFRLEARAVARLNHPNIVQIYEFAQEDGLPFFAMEHIDGISLTAWLHKSGPLPVDQAIRLTLAAARALDYARKRDVIHRDVKPENMLITREGRLKLVDFGLAKCLAANSELTQSGTVIGSPYYMSPEQSKGETVDHRTDIYSLGISLFHMLTGARPFEATSPVAILLKHVSEPLPEPPELQNLLQGRVLSVVKRMTAKDPDDRYKDYAALMKDLRGILEPQPAKTGSDSSANALIASPSLATPAAASDSSIVPDIDAGAQAVPILPSGVTMQSPPRGASRMSWLWGAVVGVLVAVVAIAILWNMLKSDVTRTLRADARRNAAVAVVPTPALAPTATPSPRPRRTALPSARKPTPHEARTERARGLIPFNPVKVAVHELDFSAAAEKLDAIQTLSRKRIEKNPQLRRRMQNIEQGIDMLKSFKQNMIEQANGKHDTQTILRLRKGGRPYVVRADDAHFWVAEANGIKRQVAWKSISPAMMLLMGAPALTQAPREDQLANLRVFAAAFRIDPNVLRIPPFPGWPDEAEKEIANALVEFVDAKAPTGPVTTPVALIVPAADVPLDAGRPGLTPRAGQRYHERPTPRPRPDRRQPLRRR